MIIFKVCWATANLLRVFPGLTIFKLRSYLGRNSLLFLLCHLYKVHTVATPHKEMRIKLFFFCPSFQSPWHYETADVLRESCLIEVHEGFYSSFSCCQPKGERINSVLKCQQSSMAPPMALRQFAGDESDTGCWHESVTVCSLLGLCRATTPRRHFYCCWKCHRHSLKSGGTHLWSSNLSWSMVQETEPHLGITVSSLNFSWSCVACQC